MMNFKLKLIEIRYIVIVLISLLGIVGVMMQDPISQDLAYHHFKDQKTIFSIPNFWNVVTNLPFLLVGIVGLYSVLRSHRIKIISDLKIAYILFFFGVSLVAVGSGYYHLSPDNSSLVWDRLPMTFAFMALFSIVLGEFISLRMGKLALWPFLVFGVFSVFYWHFTERNGEGDLRLYLLVQFLPMILIPLILMLFKSKFTHTRGYWYLLSAYFLAKLFEYFDVVVYNNFLLLSGHSIKHIVAAFGIFFLLKAYNSRELN